MKCASQYCDSAIAAGYRSARIRSVSRGSHDSPGAERPGMPRSSPQPDQRRNQGSGVFSPNSRLSIQRQKPARCTTPASTRWREPHSLAQEHAPHSARFRAENQPECNLLPPLLYRIRHQSMNARIAASSASAHSRNVISRILKALPVLAPGNEGM